MLVTTTPTAAGGLHHLHYTASLVTLCNSDNYARYETAITFCSNNTSHMETTTSTTAGVFIIFTTCTASLVTLCNSDNDAIKSCNTNTSHVGDNNVHSCRGIHRLHYTASLVTLCTSDKNARCETAICNHNNTTCHMTTANVHN